MCRAHPRSTRSLLPLHPSSRSALHRRWRSVGPPIRTVRQALQQLDSKWRQQWYTAMVRRGIFFAYVTSGKVQLVFGKAYTKAVAEMTRMAKPRSGEASEWLYSKAPQQGSSCLVATDFPFWGALVRMLSENHSYPPPTQLRRVGSWWVSLTVR